MKLTMQSVLKNKYVLYAVSALAVLNVLGYLSIGSMECLGVFAVTALVCQQYNKNMTICLLAAIFAANVIFGCGRIKENFVEGSDTATAVDVKKVADDAVKNGQLTEADKEVVDACVDKAEADCTGDCEYKNGACATKQ
jgi:hypothetical protein